MLFSIDIREFIVMSLPGLPHIPTFEKFFDFLVPRFWNSLPNNRSALILPGSNRMYISIPAYEKRDTATLK
jgi:hypothetical protein